MDNLRFWYKDGHMHVDVYDIVYDVNGYPQFLIYYDGQWLRKSAKHCSPYAPWDQEQT